MDRAVAIGFFAVFVMLALEIRHLREAAAQSQPTPGKAPRSWMLWATLGVDFLGGGLCLAGLFSTEAWLLVAVTACIAIAVVATVSLWHFWSGRSTRTADRTKAGPSGHWLRMFLKVAGGLAAIATLLFLGSLLGDGANQTPASQSPAPVGRYHINGTCVNGSCFVNECKEPAPCAGKDPAGRLFEGTPVDIECQRRGKRAKAPNGRGSYIWDRLASGVFISDLFVNTHRIGRFTKRLPRCSP